jgi:hypothetical protein
MPDDHGQPTFDEWREALSLDERTRLDDITDRLRRAGADEPQLWARSEVRENIAQSARFAFLRAVWQNLEQWRDAEFVDAYIDRVSTSDQQTGGDRDQARRLAAHVAFQATLDVIMAIDDQEDISSDVELPGWLLMEVGLDEQFTGREVGGLHESLLQVDPLGIEAEDIRGW